MSWRARGLKLQVQHPDAAEAAASPAHASPPHQGPLLSDASPRSVGANDGEERGSNASLPQAHGAGVSLAPYCFRARTFDPQARRWVPVRIAVVLPPTSLEDYEYVPEGYYPAKHHHQRCGAKGSSSGNTASREEEDKEDAQHYAEAMSSDVTVWMYVERLEERRKRRGPVKRGSSSTVGGASPVTTQPPSRVNRPRGPRAGSYDERIATEETPSGSPASSIHSHAPRWTKVKVHVMLPRAAACPLSQELRASLQLRLVDSQALTYTSHGTPRATSLAATPRAQSEGHPTQATPTLSHLNSRQSSCSHFAQAPGRGGGGAAAASLAHSHNTNGGTPPFLSVSQPVKEEGSQKQGKKDDPTTTASRDETLCARAHHFSHSSGSRQETTGYLTPPGASPAEAPPPQRLLHALVDSPQRAHSTAVSHSLSGIFKRREVVDTMAELYQIEVHGTTTASTGGNITAAERKMLRAATTKAASSLAPRRAPSSALTVSSITAQRSPGSPAPQRSYTRVKNQLLSWFSFRKDKKMTRKTKKKPSSSGTAGGPGSPSSPRRGGGRSSFPVSSPTQTSATCHLFPDGAKVAFLLRFYEETDYLMLLRWYVWMRHTRKERRRKIRERAERHKGRRYISYDPRDIEREAMADAADDSDGEKEGYTHVDNCLGWDREGNALVPAASASLNVSSPYTSAGDVGGGGGGGATLLGGGGSTIGPLALDTRWEDYIRRARDPRNDIPFAHTPVFLWHSFLPHSANVCYHCARGFLSVEAAHSNSDDAVLSPVKTAKRLEPEEGLPHDSSGKSLSATARPGHPRRLRNASWDTVKLVVSSPLAPRPPTDEGVVPYSTNGGFPTASPQSCTGSQDSRRVGASPTAPSVTTTSIPAGSAASQQHHHHAHSRHKEDRWASSSFSAHHPLGAEFKDCFMCLTESHLLFYNSFGELKVHCNLDHVEAVLFSATHGTARPTMTAAQQANRRSAPAQRRFSRASPANSVEGASSKDGRAAGGVDRDEQATTDNDADTSVPPSYPFVTFKLRAGRHEMHEPPLIVTFTFLPLYPHFTKDSLAQDDVAVTPSLPNFSSVYARFPEGSPSGRGRHRGGEVDGSDFYYSHHDSENSSSSGDDDEEEEDMEVYQARMLAQSNVLNVRKQEFLQALRDVLPNTAKDSITFDMYVRIVRKQAALPVHPTMGRLGGDGFDSKIPFVEIYREDVAAHPARQVSSLSDSTTSFSADGRCASSPHLGTSCASESRPPSRVPTSHGCAQSLGALPTVGPHGLTLDFNNPKHLDDGSPLSLPAYVTVPKNRAAASYSGIEEHRRLRNVYAATSSLSRCMAAGTPRAMASPAAEMEKVNDFDLTVRLASQPAPLLLEKEDLFLPPLHYYASGSLTSSAYHSSVTSRQDVAGAGIEKTSSQSEVYHGSLGGGSEHTAPPGSHLNRRRRHNESSARVDVTLGTASEDIQFGDIEASPVARRKPAQRDVSAVPSSTSSPLRQDAGNAPQPQRKTTTATTASAVEDDHLSPDAGSPYAIMRPKKRKSLLGRRRKAE